MIRMVPASAHPVSVKLLDSLLKLEDGLRTAARITIDLCHRLFDSVNLEILIRFTQLFLCLKQNEDSKSFARLSEITIKFEKRLPLSSCFQYAYCINSSSSLFPQPDWFSNMCKLPFTVPCSLLLLALIVDILSEQLINLDTPVDRSSNGAVVDGHPLVEVFLRSEHAPRKHETCRHWTRKLIFCSLTWIHLIVFFS